MTGYTKEDGVMGTRGKRREKTEANDCSLCVMFMTEGDYSCVVFHSTVYQVCKLRVKLVIIIAMTDELLSHCLPPLVSTNP